MTLIKWDSIFYKCLYCLEQKVSDWSDSGQFHCPNCNIKEEYGKKYVQDWFTLFFIPVFPISGKK